MEARGYLRNFSEALLPLGPRAQIVRAAEVDKRKVIVFGAGEVKFLARHLPSVSNEYLALVFYSGLNRRILAQVDL